MNPLSLAAWTYVAPNGKILEQFVGIKCQQSKQDPFPQQYKNCSLQVSDATESVR